MSKVTIVWNNHGDGKLVGVFDDQKEINKLKSIISIKHEESYIRFIEVEMNYLNNKNLKPDIS